MTKILRDIKIDWLFGREHNIYKEFKNNFHNIRKVEHETDIIYYQGDKWIFRYNINKKRISIEKGGFTIFSHLLINKFKYDVREKIYITLLQKYLELDIKEVGFTK